MDLVRNPFRNAGTGSKDVLMMLDSLGYKYQIIGNRVTLDPAIINEISEKTYQNYFDSLVDPLENRLNLNRRMPKVSNKLVSTFRNITPIKGVEFINLLADLTLIVISSAILLDFLLYTPTAIGEFLVLVFIGVIASDLVQTLFHLTGPVVDILTKKYKFQKDQTTYVIGYSKLLRTLILMKYRIVIYSFVFLTIFLLGNFLRSAPMQFVSETVDFIAFFFAIGSLLLKGVVNLKLGGSIRPSSNFYLSIAIGVFFFILVLLKDATHSSILYYLLIVIEAPLLIFYFLYAILDVRVFPV